MNAPMTPLAEIARQLRSGATSSVALVQSCLARASDPGGEGARTFLRLHAEQARAAAAAVDRARQAGATLPPFAGVPVSIKDLFDIEGEVTTAGSAVLADSPAADRDALAVARLKAAGFIVVGRTNMTEFAYSGLGLNPHYGTPLNPFDRATGRAPGGSSSGAAVSVTDGMAAVALGTDTGGSCRIPAALVGLVGFKPTQSRTPTHGTVPLSTTLDSVGPLAPTVACCAAVDAVLAGEPLSALEPMPLRGLRLAVPQTVVLDGMDDAVSAAFAHALSTLSAAGATLVELPLREFGELAQINAKGGFGAAESYAWHRALLSRAADRYDPRVRVRIEKGALQSAADYLDLQATRRDWIRRVTARCEGFDALVCPTVPAIAPRLADLVADDDYNRWNLLMLRNPSVVNFLDGCAISVPCHQAGEAPIGLMLAGGHGRDRPLLSIALSVESVLPAGAGADR